MAKLNDKQLVMAKYPEAGIIWLNKDMCYVNAFGGSKLNGGVPLSGQFMKESEAWADAAKRLGESKG